jgi:hypothetical protein
MVTVVSPPAIAVKGTPIATHGKKFATTNFCNKERGFEESGR